MIPPLCFPLLHLPPSVALSLWLSVFPSSFSLPISLSVSLSLSFAFTNIYVVDRVGDGERVRAGQTMRVWLARHTSLPFPSLQTLNPQLYDSKPYECPAASDVPGTAKREDRRHLAKRCPDPRLGSVAGTENSHKCWWRWRFSRIRNRRAVVVS